MAKKITLVLGGARSGKSSYAQNMIEETGQPAWFVATATAGDEEMASRIIAHRASRSAQWATIEAPTGVGKALAQAEPRPFGLVDCITLLANNILMTLPEPIDEQAYEQAMLAEIEALLAALASQPGEWYIISNEVGLGLVPPYPLGRYYRDVLGRANQRLAAAADSVLFMVAGLPMLVK